MDLFEQNSSQAPTPLAEALRPQALSELLGQERLHQGERGLLKKLTQGQLQSLILWGPPGSGKTSFARALLQESPGDLFEENAIDLGTKRIREIGDRARRRLLESQVQSLLFVDEIHRLNRGQQDVLLPFIEKGHFYLVGATTENPSYELNSALMSRCRLLVFEPLGPGALAELLRRACEYTQVPIEDVLDTSAQEALIGQSHGDGRRLLNLFESILLHYRDSQESFPWGLELLNKTFSQSTLRFDKKGDEHYDTISAFIKSLRGSDPNAALYYLARLIEGGEDPTFIARRMVIFASEDVGNADPQALGLALSVFRAVEVIGLPEARINLAQGVTYLSCAPKSNRSYVAVDKALQEVRRSGPLPIPQDLRSASTSLMKDIGYGKNYKYPHEGATGWLPQDYFPKELKTRDFYEPSGRGFEKRMAEYLNWMRGQGQKDGKD